MGWNMGYLFTVHPIHVSRALFWNYNQVQLTIYFHYCYPKILCLKLFLSALLMPENIYIFVIRYKIIIILDYNANFDPMTKRYILTY